MTVAPHTDVAHFFFFHHNIISLARCTLSSTCLTPPFSLCLPCLLSFVFVRRLGSICLQFLDLYHRLLTQLSGHALLLFLCLF